MAALIKHKGYLGPELARFYCPQLVRIFFLFKKTPPFQRN